MESKKTQTDPRSFFANRRHIALIAISQELEDLSNAAAKRCNRLRVWLDTEQRGELEAALAVLAPALDMAAAGTPRGRSAALDRGHAPITTCAAEVHRNTAASARQSHGVWRCLHSRGFDGRSHSCIWQISAVKVLTETSLYMHRSDEATLSLQLLTRRTEMTGCQDMPRFLRLALACSLPRRPRALWPRFTT